MARARPDQPDGVAGGATHRVARSLRDAGFEVIDAGPTASPSHVVQVVVEEDADAVTVPPDAMAPVAAALADAGLARVLVIGTGPTGEPVAHPAATDGPGPTTLSDRLLHALGPPTSRPT